MLSLLTRLATASEADDRQKRILDARVNGNLLHVVSTDFDRLDVPINEIPAFRNRKSDTVQKFEIDEDGSFIYWPGLDVHLGWRQLQQVVDPDAAFKAMQKHQEFNARYGRAVRTVRKKAGIKPVDVQGLSDKQLRRIEKGECRLTSNAIAALAKAHKLAPNDYLEKLSEEFSQVRPSPESRYE